MARERDGTTHVQSEGIKQASTCHLCVCNASAALVHSVFVTIQAQQVFHKLLAGERLQ